MTKIDLTQTIKEIDGVAAYVFGVQTQPDENGKPVQSPINLTFQQLLNLSLRVYVSRTPEAKVLTANLAAKVFSAAVDTEYTDEEVDVLNAIMQTQPDIIYSQFTALRIVV